MKVLFVRFSSLGDVILTTGVMQHLSRLMPEAEIDVLTFKQYAPVFENLPFVHDVFDYDKAKGIKEYFYIVQNELEDHDYIFDLHGKLRSKFLKYHTKAKYLCYQKDSKVRRDFVKKRKFSDRLDMHVVEKYFEPVASAFNYEMPDIEELHPALVRHQNVNEKHVLIHPFASKNTKAYPYAGELAEELISRGFTPVFAGIGGAPDMKGVIDKTGAKSVSELLDDIASCEGVISTDSGPMHAAVGLDKPTIGIFGSTTKHFGFYPSFEKSAVIENSDLDCRPCHVHGQDECPKSHFECMKTLTPQSVADKLESII